MLTPQGCWDDRERQTTLVGNPQQRGAVVAQPEMEKRRSPLV
jgi:hypothetical protein